MPSSIYSIINIILPEFGKKKILKINVMKFNKNSIQEEFSLNLHNKQWFFVMRAVLQYSVTWMVVMVMPRSLMSLILAQLVYSSCFSRHGELRVDTLLWQFHLQDTWFVHYDWRHHQSKPKTRMNLPPCFVLFFFLMLVKM